MSHDDFRTFLLFLGGILVSITAWVWRLSTRVTTTEVKIDNNVQNIKDNSTRADNQFANIQTTLHRIEDKIDRQRAESQQHDR